MYVNTCSKYVFTILFHVCYLRQFKQVEELYDWNIINIKIWIYSIYILLLVTCVLTRGNFYNYFPVVVVEVTSV